MMGYFPGGPVVKNPPYSAGDLGLIPGQGTKIPLAAGQLSLHASTREEKTRTPQLERSPSAAMKSPRAATKNPTCLNEDPACRN